MKKTILIAVFLGSILAMAKDSKESELITSKIKAFYSRYLILLENKDPNKEKLKKTEAERKRLLKEYLSPRFFKDFDRRIRKFGLDPVLLAQDWGEDFKNKIKVINIQMTTDSSAVAEVNLGELPQGNLSTGPSHLILSLVKIKSNWRIDSVER